MPITVNIQPPNATNKAVRWSVSNKNITIGTDNVVTGNTIGDTIATLTTIDGEFKAKLNITVTE
ncbi:hypothetical protein AXI71_gp35 [Lactococcus phage GE1]|uniref:BIG2 domain-containing protein n=1 Tax=Lactococcus phage GE1 TaxID=1698369 RepID=A0A0N7E0P8_9CAUD|nr:hypothetical protein AXI71_gp35 [Lactococcus phage GE1]ALA06989.1 hypothetical protein [Lactococcus phage GE1]